MNPNLDQFAVSGGAAARPAAPFGLVARSRTGICAHLSTTIPVRGGLDFGPRRLLKAWGAIDPSQSAGSVWEASPRGSRPLPVSGIGVGSLAQGQPTPPSQR